MNEVYNCLDELVYRVGQVARVLDRARPTWIDEKGRVHVIADMPTRYLQNVERFVARGGISAGLYAYITRELASRRDD
jgi:hypothetical protein